MGLKLLDFVKIFKAYVQQIITEDNKKLEEGRMNSLFRADIILGNK